MRTGSKQMNGLRATMIALALFAVAGSPVLAHQTTPLFRALTVHLIENRGDDQWPWAPRENADSLGSANVVHVRGEIVGPAGFHRTVDIGHMNANITWARSLGSEGEYAIRARAEAGRIDMAFGIYVNGMTRVSSMSQVRSGRSVTMDLGDGYLANLTLLVRDATPKEREALAALDGSVRPRAPAEAPETAITGGLPAPVTSSPFTNSVIREGDERAEPMN